MELRDYQIETINNFEDWKNSTENLATVILPMGCGKTVIAANFILKFNDVVLFASHRNEIINQAAETIKLFNPTLKVTIEAGKSRGESDSNVIVGTVQTLIKKRKNLREFNPKLIIFDEYHHAEEHNVQYENLKKRWPAAKIVGLTATPWRTDDNPIKTGRILIQMNIMDAINKGLLVNPIFEHPSLLETLNFSIKNKTLSGKDQIFIERIKQLVKEGRQGLIYGRDKEHAQELYNTLKNDIRVAEIYAETPLSERQVYYEALKSKKLDAIINNMILTEGVDFPQISFLALFREPESLSLWLQIVGRGLRKYQDKKDCIILDASPNGEKDIKLSYDILSYQNKEIDLKIVKTSAPQLVNKYAKRILSGIANKLIKI